MAIASHVLSQCYAPVQAFIAWLSLPFAPAPVAQRATFTPQPVLRPACLRKPTRPARVVRVHRGPHRLVIAGRMSDVCAELERLAALEMDAGSRPA